MQQKMQANVSMDMKPFNGLHVRKWTRIGSSLKRFDIGRATLSDGRTVYITWGMNMRIRFAGRSGNAVVTGRDWNTEEPFCEFILSNKTARNLLREYNQVTEKRIADRKNRRVK